LNKKRKFSYLIDVDERFDQSLFVVLLLLRLRLLHLKDYFHRILILHHLDFHLLFAFLIVYLYQNHFPPKITKKKNKQIFVDKYALTKSSVSSGIVLTLFRDDPPRQ
jgi:hypothetical protein